MVAAVISLPKLKKKNPEEGITHLQQPILEINNRIKNIIK
jgi:hypothetical protein